MEARTKGRPSSSADGRKAQGSGDLGDRAGWKAEDPSRVSAWFLRLPVIEKGNLREQRGSRPRLGQLAPFSEKVTSAANSEEDYSCSQGCYED